MLNRSVPPAAQPVRQISILRPQKFLLSNGLPVYGIFDLEQEILQIVWAFAVGEYDATLPAQALYAVKMLAEGTRRKSAHQINEEIDNYGGFIELHANEDQTTITLFTPARFAENTIPIVAEILLEASFPEEEWQLFLLQQKQELEVNLQKTSFLAKNALLQALFHNHPYGKAVTLDLLDKYPKKEVIAFYENHLLKKPFCIYVTGNFSEKIISILEENFAKLSFTSVEKKPVEIKSKVDKILVKKDDVLQNTIRIGKIVVGRNHQDYTSLNVCVTLLGGYFGSRLMQNLRESKGLTYGVSSFLKNMQWASYLLIGTDVRAEAYKIALQEIYREISILQEQKVTDSELTKVKNYIAGAFVSELTNATAHMSLFSIVKLHGLEENYFDYFLERIYNITPDDIINIAQKYLKTHEMIEVVAGRGD